MPKNQNDNINKQQPIRKSRSPKRILIKKKGKIDKNALHGYAVATIGSIVIVESDNQLFECVIGGILISEYKDSTLVTVGDEVWFILDENENTIKIEGLDKGIIKKVGKRWTKLSRKSPGKGISEHVLAANADQLMILMSAKNPTYNKRLIDRYQIAAELGDLDVILCINKIDLLDDDELEYLKDDLQVYIELGDKIVYITAQNENDVLRLQDNYLKDKTTIFSGPSGVGKSTLVNNLLGKDIQAVNEISETTAKGRHTTSFTKAFKLHKGGKVIDTPGIREFALWDIEQSELPLFFRDFKDYYLNCKYNSCTHTHEPGCAVKDAVENEDIQFDRYESYLNLYFSFEE
jgi:ribosome biogenesis GTPase